MKQTAFIFSLIVSATCFGQATLTKEETMNYINKKLRETYNLDFIYEFNAIYQQEPRLTTKFDKMFIIENNFSLESDGRIVHVDKIATTLTGCNANDWTIYGAQSTRVSFNPLHITKVEIRNTNDSRIGQILVSFLANTPKWDKHKYTYKIKTEKTKRVFSHYDFWGNAVYYNQNYSTYNCEYGWTSTAVPTGDLVIYYFKSDPENGPRLIKAFNHLVALYKAEDDPFGN
jgi:hypothetical protein